VIGLDEIRAAHERIAPHVVRTPVIALGSGGPWLKAECLQPTGAFKLRGAINTVLQLDDEQRRRGVLTFSSGNHAQAAALAGRLLGIDVQVVMPADAPPVKLAATRSYGATIITYHREETSREALAARIAEETGRAVVPPYDHPHIVAGQGTAALELFEDAGTLDALLVPCGGGGLLSGSAIAAAALAPGCRVIGVEPEAGADATASFRTGVLHRVDNPDTIADGARTPHLGRVTFPLVRRFVHEMVTVPDGALVRAVRFLAERMKLVVEPTGALAVAALLEGVVPAAPRTGVIISGGNVDLAALTRWLAPPAS
jgi:threonine dehydratase